jgi:hypothetical protein
VALIHARNVLVSYVESLCPAVCALNECRVEKASVIPA